jgi:hypothetical protein
VGGRAEGETRTQHCRGRTRQQECARRVEAPEQRRALPAAAIASEPEQRHWSASAARTAGPADWPARCGARRRGSETGGFPAALQVSERAGGKSALTRSEDASVHESHPRLRGVRAMVLADRTDRHSSEPATCRAFEARTPIRRRVRGFPSGPRATVVAPLSQAAYTTATGSLPTHCLLPQQTSGRGPCMTRHSSLDEGCLQQRSGGSGKNPRIHYVSSGIRDVLARIRRASGRTKNPLIFQRKQAVYRRLQARG